MRKLTLDPDALHVQSFATHDGAAYPFGTVHGRQKENTGVRDVQCSALVPCESALGCSEGNSCRAECSRECPSAEAGCPSTPDCTPVFPCHEREPSAADACPSTGDGCNETLVCPPLACPGPMSLVSCTE